MILQAIYTEPNSGTTTAKVVFEPTKDIAPVIHQISNADAESMLHDLLQKFGMDRPFTMTEFEVTYRKRVTAIGPREGWVEWELTIDITFH
jgi:hypothetical protein